MTNKTLNSFLFFNLIAVVFLFLPAAQAQKDVKMKQDVAVVKLEMKFLRELNLQKPLEDGRGAYVSAASGIVKKDKKFFVISDDEQSVFSFGLDDKHLSVFPVLKESLPANNDERKKNKADFESLAILNASQWPPHGALVAWPSASTSNRMRAVTLPFTDEKGNLGEPVISNILALAYELQPKLKEINFEGLVVRDDKVLIFQRGNSKKGKNGFVEMSLKSWITGLKDGNWRTKFKFENLKVGTLNGVKLTFSDAILTKYGVLALASAEDTQSAYSDGEVHGTILTRLVDGQTEILGQLMPTSKIEGLAAEETADGLDLYLVEDADDPKKASKLYMVQLKDSVITGVKK